MTLRHLPFAICYLLSALLARADTVTLNDGKTLTATITGYDKMTFDALADKGKPLKLPAATVKRIDFAKRIAPTRLETRTGDLDTHLLRYEAAAFHCESRDGKPRAVASILVSRVLLAREAGDGDNDTGGDARPVNIPDAISRGNAVPLDTLLVPGKVTILFFFGSLGQHGVQCQFVNNHLDNVFKKDPAIVIRKLDIGEWESDLANQYQVTAIPRLDIYDSKGKLSQTILGHRPGDLTAALKRIK
jgi:hypothetical protein